MINPVWKYINFSVFLGMILVLTIQAVIQIRQRYQRYMSRSNEPLVGILFHDIQRSDADKGLLPCLKFLLNYGFYKFGVEVSINFCLIL